MDTCHRPPFVIGTESFLLHSPSTPMIRSLCLLGEIVSGKKVTLDLGLRKGGI